MTCELVMIGTSAGGVSALQRLLRSWPAELQQPLVVVQHLPSGADIDPGLIFGHLSARPMREALDKMPIEAGHVYFAPAGYHLLIERDSSFSLSVDEPLNFSRPSIDVLFQSGAEAFGEAACGILMTGANSDGARGLKSIQARGGITVVQDPDDAEIGAMPRAALEIMRPDFIGPIEDIGRAILELQRECVE